MAGPEHRISDSSQPLSMPRRHIVTSRGPAEIPQMQNCRIRDLGALFPLPGEWEMLSGEWEMHSGEWKIIVFGNVSGSIVM